MAWQRFPPESLPCYTYGGIDRECRDVVVARRIARECQQPHQVIPVGDEFFARFPHYAERSVYLTDACVEVTRAPDLVPQREGSRDCPSEDDRTLRGRNTAPPDASVQAGRIPLRGC